MKQIKVLIADDHPLVRSGLITMLSEHQEIEVIGEAGTGEEAVEITRKLKPDLVLMDISMPGMSGLEASEIIKRESPDTAIVVLTMHEEKEYIYNTLRLPIDGLLHKSADKEEIISAVRSAAAGTKYYGKTVSEVLVNHFVDKFPGIGNKEELVLTKREKEILPLIAEGLSTSEIAERLSISPRTVDTHRSNLIQKYNLKNPVGLLKFAIDYLSSQKKTT